MDAQKAFRTVLEAMANPGRILELGEGLQPPSPINRAAGAICLTLLDFETPLWHDLENESAAVEWLNFHCGCPTTDDGREVAFALVTGPTSGPSLDRFAAGEEDSPERSATLILQVESLAGGRGMKLTGPGIDGSRRLQVSGVPDRLWRERRAQEEFYPLGVDLVLATDSALAALPRTTRIERED